MTRLVGSRAELHEALAGRTGRVALVPTMGALHEGHAALVARARREVGDDAPLVVSVFVNPLQFAPGEDLDRYPRTLDADLEVCAAGGVDLVLAPSVDEVYPGGPPEVTVHPGPLGARLEGASRPTHFTGVLTVVAKLFGLVRPDVAVFGEKDYQQLALVRRMAEDLCLGVDVVGATTVREADGLALSSRNRFLDAEARAHALALSRALAAGRDAAPRGAAAVLAAARAELDGAAGVDLDYLELGAPDLGPAPAAGPARLLVAARVGGVRLIDNTGLELGPDLPS
ncbi:pantothenate synthetase [Nocardioides scoriae]|uniref:Pantothenate synthetase n=1 Tax=Nocardioides scoriae TaxID=642780 RepID=A0A1H1TY73_9ACTN|nr:pantoate--beta-alanine ligase [Nocardioides scoriae]SDS65215.1 pantothenate synthetase [Nocardioides scoriae]